jgi:hypothetical protein
VFSLYWFPTVLFAGGRVICIGAPQFHGSTDC